MLRHVVIMGPQGAGKGTQAERIAPRLDLVHLATGDLFRALMAQVSELAREVRSYYDAGNLVPDALTARVLFEALDTSAREQQPVGALIDGFPRNRAQAEVLDETIETRGEQLIAVVHIGAPHDVLMRRLSGRLICRICGRTYHREFQPPQAEGVCDVCGGDLYQRSDDTPEAVERRLSIYYEQTEPLLEFWRPRGIVHDIDGDRPVDEVTASIVAELEPALRRTER